MEEGGGGGRSEKGKTIKSSSGKLIIEGLDARMHAKLQQKETRRQKLTFSLASSAACPSRTIPKMIESPLSNAGCGPRVISN